MYKLELICVKYVPILIALITLIDVILYYFDIDFELINYIAGTSFLTMIPMYISPLGDFMLLVLYLIIAGIFAFLALYLHQKYGGRKNN